MLKDVCFNIMAKDTYQVNVYRISNALKQSANFNRPLPHTGDTIINRKAIIRMQSKFLFKLYVRKNILHYIVVQLNLITFYW